MLKGLKNVIGLLVVLSFSSCQFLEKKTEEKELARVGDQYLYESDLARVLPENMTKEDSVSFAKQYINNWATKQILKQKATINLDEAKQLEFEYLAEEYKLDLYTNAYMDALIARQLDTIVSEADLDTLYQHSRQNFKLNEELLKFRYISIDKEHKDFKTIKSRFERFDSLDREVLDSLSIQFHSFMLNDSLWVKKSQLLNKLPILNTEENLQLLKKSNLLHVEDSLRVYLVRVNDLLKRQEQAPKAYVAPTLRQIILNKRKLKLIKQLEIDIRKDAEQNNEFEIYN